MQENITSLTKTVARMVDSSAKMFESQARMEQWVFGNTVNDREKVGDPEGGRRVIFTNKQIVGESYKNADESEECEKGHHGSMKIKDSVGEKLSIFNEADQGRDESRQVIRGVDRNVFEIVEPTCEFLRDMAKSEGDESKECSNSLGRPKKPMMVTIDTKEEASEEWLIVELLQRFSDRKALKEDFESSRMQEWRVGLDDEDFQMVLPQISVLEKKEHMDCQFLRPRIVRWGEEIANGPFAI
ncbi:uncharacterized protein [Primulina eburnea]|uniref:uncharacterized protein n=1 Tax=Primulina eburnea TaxID=1245227 RepID=UPI003C6BE19E